MQFAVSMLAAYASVFVGQRGTVPGIFMPPLDPRDEVEVKQMWSDDSAEEKQKAVLAMVLGSGDTVTGAIASAAKANEKSAVADAKAALKKERDEAIAKAKEELASTTKAVTEKFDAEQTAAKEALKAAEAEEKERRGIADAALKALAGNKDMAADTKQANERAEAAAKKSIAALQEKLDAFGGAKAAIRAKLGGRDNKKAKATERDEKIKAAEEKLEAATEAAKDAFKDKLGKAETEALAEVTKQKGLASVAARAGFPFTEACKMLIDLKTKGGEDYPPRFPADKVESGFPYCDVWAATLVGLATMACYCLLVGLPILADDLSLNGLIGVLIRGSVVTIAATITGFVAGWAIRKLLKAAASGKAMEDGIDGYLFKLAQSGVGKRMFAFVLIIEVASFATGLATGALMPG